MPASLRLGALFLGASVFAAAIGITGVYWQDDRQARTRAETMTQGNADAGKAAIDRFGCVACHRIPGIKSGAGSVGPSLQRFATRSVIAGRLSNEPANLVLWLQEPQRIAPGSAMPDLGLEPAQARDIAAYLYTLR